MGCDGSQMIKVCKEVTHCQASAHLEEDDKGSHTPVLWNKLCGREPNPTTMSHFCRPTCAHRAHLAPWSTDPIAAWMTHFRFHDLDSWVVRENVRCCVCSGSGGVPTATSCEAKTILGGVEPPEFKFSKRKYPEGILFESDALSIQPQDQLRNPCSGRVVQRQVS